VIHSETQYDTVRHSETQYNKVDKVDKTENINLGLLHPHASAPSSSCVGDFLLVEVSVFYGFGLGNSLTILMTPFEPSSLRGSMAL
jgi:hypothetical protein